MKRFVQFSISLLLIGLILHAVFVRFDMRQTTASVVGASPVFLITALMLLITGYFLRAARWQIWERSLGYWDSFRLILLGFMGNNVLPARLGEILRAHCAAAKTDSERGRTTAVASIGAERVLDGLMLALFGLIAFRVVPIDRQLRGALLVVSLAFVSMSLALVASIRFHQRIRSLITAANRKFPGHITAFAREKAIQLLDGLLPLGTLRRMVGAVVATATIWGVELAAYYCFGRAVWGGMNLGSAFLALVVVNFASLVPLTMGGIGTVEAAAPAYLVSSGVPAHLALAMVLLVHAGQYLFTTITGGIVYLAGGFYRIPLASPKAVPRSLTHSEPSSVLQETNSNLSLLREAVGLEPMPRDQIQLSIVIPAYNEQARLPKTVLETIHWCRTRDLAFEILLVDDGSRDETLALARLFEESDVRIRAIACPHMGKGATVRMGVLNAKGRLVLFMDADGATPLEEIPKLLAAIDDGRDIAIGSRSVQRPGDVEVKTSLHRRLIGRTFAFLVNLFAFDGIGDTQCGFKMFRREAAAEIFSRQKIVGFAFDVEILFIARRLSFSISEIPVNWVAQPGSKVNLVTDSVKMLWDISHIRWLHRNLQASPSQTQQRHFVVSSGMRLGS